MSDLETEATQDTATFEHFGRKWTVPTRRHARHTHFLKNEFRAGFGTWYLLLAEAFLSPEVSKANQQEPDQFEAFLEIDPDDEAGKDFAAALSKAVGFGDSGNSEPSSASSS